MAHSIGHMLSRRGRKGARETDLDSVWGDAKITSPTDSAPIRQSDSPQLDARLAHVNPTSRLDAMPINVRRSPGQSDHPKRIQVQGTKQKTTINLTSDDYTKKDTSRSRPRIWSSRSQSHNRSEALLRDLTPPEWSAPLSQSAQPQSARTSWTKEDYFGYIAALNANMANPGVISPPLSDVSATPQISKAGPFFADYAQAQETNAHSHGSISPDEMPAIIRRSRPRSNSLHKDLSVGGGTQLNRPNSYRAEHFYSPMINMLSPVSETFASNITNDSTDDVVTRDNKPQSNAQRSSGPSIKHRRLSSLDHQHCHQSAVPSTPGLEPVPSRSRARADTEYGHVTSTTTLFHPVPQSCRAMHYESGMGIDFGSALSPALPVEDTMTIIEGNDGTTTPPIPGRSALRNTSRVGSDDIQDRAASANMASPSLGITGVRRTQASSLGITQMMQKHSSLAGLLEDEDPKSETRRSRWDRRPKPASLQPSRPYQGSKQRSASLEPLASPSYFIPSTPSTPISAECQTSPHQYYRFSYQESTKDTCTCHCTCQMTDEHSRTAKLAEAARYGRKQRTSDQADSHRRSRSQAVPPSSDLHLRRQSYEFSQLDPQSEFDNRSNTAFYNEITEDFRKLTLERGALHDVEGYARTEMTDVENKAESKRSSRGRSGSRSRTPSTHKGAPQEEMIEVVNPRLVRSYSQLWM